MRRAPALVLSAALVAGLRLLPASGDAGDPPLPHLDCAGAMTDPKGDADPDWLGGHTTKPVIGNNPSLDLLGVFLRLTPDQLQVFVPVDHIDASTMQPYEASYRYIVTFKMKGKLFTYGNEVRNSGNPAQPLDGSSYPTMNMGTGGQDLPGSTAVIRTGTAPDPSWLIFTSPRDRMEKNFGAPIEPGDAFTEIQAHTQVWSSQAHADADSTTQSGAAATHVAGDDSCFGPPPTSLGSVSLPAVQWSDSSLLSAVLLDAAGKPIAGKTVSFTVADGHNTTVSATTDAAGKAVARYGPVRVKAGSYPVTVRFAGDDTGKAAVATGTLKVAVEKTVFRALTVAKPSATARVVTATLVDDDRAPVAKVAVDWWVNGKRVARTTSDRYGRAVLRTAKHGQTVQAKFAGVAGTLAASASKALKV